MCSIKISHNHGNNCNASSVKKWRMSGNSYQHGGYSEIQVTRKGHLSNDEGNEPPQEALNNKPLSNRLVQVVRCVCSFAKWSL
jgi:hypothetical protein